MKIQNLCAALALVSALASSARADDFCPNLKAAIASAPKNFTNLAGAADDVIPGWRDAKITLPFATSCSIDTDKRNISYFCAWQREQGAAVNARYKYTVQRTDQCLVGFQKTVEDRITTWRDSKGETVIVDSRHVMKNTETWSLRLTVRP